MAAGRIILRDVLTWVEQNALVTLLLKDDLHQKGTNAAPLCHTVLCSTPGWTLTKGKKGLKSFRFENILRWKKIMPTSEQTTEQFVQFLQRLMRLRPKLIFQDESIARIRKQMQDLKASGAGNHEDRIFLFRILDILAHSEAPPTMGELSSELGSRLVLQRAWPTGWCARNSLRGAMIRVTGGSCDCALRRPGVNSSRRPQAI